MMVPGLGLWLLALALALGSAVAFQSDEIQGTVSAVWWQAGNTATLRCTYSSNASYVYVAWYRQRPGGPLQYLLQSKGRGGSYSHTAPFYHKRFSCQADESSGTLFISGLELEDSALYYCSLQGPQWEIPGARLNNISFLFSCPLLHVRRGHSPSPWRVNEQAVPGIRDGVGLIVSGCCQRPRDVWKLGRADVWAERSWGEVRRTCSGHVSHPVFCHPGRGGFVGQRRRRCPVRGRRGGAGRSGPEPNSARLLSGSRMMMPALGPWLLALALALGSAGVWAHFRLEETGGGLRAPGDSVLLSCRGYGYNFENYPFRWYRQAPGGRLEWVSLSWSLGATEYAAAVEGRATVSWDNSQSKSSLSLHALQPQDSARYFCAVVIETRITSVGLHKLVFGSGTTLTVEPNIQKSSVPQVILMKSKKLKEDDSTGKAACLARNVYTKNISLDMSSNEVAYEPSASILTSEGLYDTIKVVSVTKGTEVNCMAHFNGSTITASTSLAEEHAEDPEMGKVCNTTDTSAQAGAKVEKANMLSMAVLGLRVLLAKSIAFNTLMSIKLFLF
ncbi:uncharacterized protein LOC136023970 [Lathamus discolor]|uniref:uncharacterized protein LOC136023970 n=1 Tax=Lathamus discolor TaxID=678569 RepID=UPI0032B73A6C